MTFLKQNWLKIFVGVLILFFVFFVRKWGSSQSEIVISKIPPSKTELCNSIIGVTPLPEELEYDKSIRSDPFVQHLRKALDDPGNPKLSSNYDNLANLDNYRDYIGSKFIVISTDIAAGGGASIILIFKDKPDKVFYAWVRDYKDNSGFDLRSFTEYDLTKPDRPSIQETQKLFSNQICGDTFGI